MIPDNITNKHILLALEEIDAEGIRKGRHSTTYDLLYKEKAYPPKLVISIANKFANGTELEGNQFPAGMGHAAFKLLKREGFDIVPKNDSVKGLISQYKSMISTTRMEDEVYKWEMINVNQGRPNTDSADFQKEVKEVKFKNTIYHLGPAVLNHIARENPEGLREQFKNLFNEDDDLSMRVKAFDQGTLNIYRDFEKKQSHHQDERSISNYLTFIYPSKYTFYKASFYSKYCKLLAIPQAKKNKKYAHYLELIEELIENYISTDQALIDQVKEYIPEYYDGTNHLLLAQDILYQVLDKDVESNYWIFQANPNVWDYETALKEDRLADWTVSAHKDKIKAGDKVIIWVTGKHAGCYALAEVISEPQLKEKSPDDDLWLKESIKNYPKADIKITHNLINSSVSKDLLSELKDLKVGNQGTNFSATKLEYDTIRDIAESMNEGSYSRILKALDNKKVEKYFSILRSFVRNEKLKANDERISFNIRSNWNRLAFIIGSRYVFCIHKKRGETYFSFISQDKLSSKSDPFGDYKGDTEAYWNVAPEIDEFEELLRKSMNIELKRNRKNPYKRLTNNDFLNDVYEKSRTRSVGAMKIFNSKNTILYGPPGTGKTYTLKNQYFKHFTSFENIVTREEYVANVADKLSWWEAIAIAVMELGQTKVATIAAHELVKRKMATSVSKTITPTIWSQLQSHTVDECKYVNVAKRSQIQVFNKNEKSEWEILIDRVEEQVPDLLKIKSEIDTYVPKTEPKKRYIFTTFHQSFGYEDFIEGIKPIIYEDENNPETGKQVIYEIKPGLFKQIVQDAIIDRDNDYAIFIDEINRGNVANIFGELITLIEDDKRIGEDNYISAKLPYSGEQFGVPPNLYIIGTMNTADRSVEALDTALRRRFSFVEMLPDPEILSQAEYECQGVNLTTLLKSINGRIEKLLDKDYCIGHSYFMSITNRDNPLAELSTIFENKILPLLQEYFYGDWGKIRLVLGEKFVEQKNDSVKFLSRNMEEDYEEYNEKAIYFFKDPSTWDIESIKSIYE
jgi:hypothetical protein